MVEFGIKKRTGNVAQFSTDSTRIAKKWINELEKRKIKYTLGVTLYRDHKSFTFRFFGCNKTKVIPDLMLLWSEDAL